MTSQPHIQAVNGLVYITDMALDHDALFELMAEWNFKNSEAEEDFHARRLNAYEKSSAIANSAAEEVRSEAGLALTWQTVLAILEPLADAAARARRQEQAAERAARISPLLRKA